MLPFRAPSCHHLLPHCTLHNALAVRLALTSNIVSGAAVSCCTAKHGPVQEYNHIDYTGSMVISLEWASLFSTSWKACCVILAVSLLFSLDELFGAVSAFASCCCGPALNTLAELGSPGAQSWLEACSGLPPPPTPEPHRARHSGLTPDRLIGFELYVLIEVTREGGFY